MRVRVILVLVALLISSCSITQKQAVPSPSSTIISKKNAYFIEASITKLSSIQCPCIDVEIDSRQFSMELDLGFRGDLSIEEDHIDLIVEKSFVLEKIMHGVRGKQYPTKIYRIPKAKIGKMTFINPRLEKGSREFTKNSTFVADGGRPSPREEGRIGWHLFQKVNLLIDMKNSRVAFCDSLNTLADQGYPIENFIRTPLVLDNGLVQIIGNTPEGALHCMLDTGATWNILNRALKPHQSLDKAVWEPENILEFSYFKIDQEDFGPINFHRMPIQLPFLVDAILGIEFFEKNLVYLDFVRGFAYFAKDQSMTTNDEKWNLRLK